MHIKVGVHGKMPLTADARSGTTAPPGHQCAGRAGPPYGANGGKAASRCFQAPKPRKRRAGEVARAARAARDAPARARARAGARVLAVEAVRVAPPLQPATAVVPVVVPRDGLGLGRAVDQLLCSGAPATVHGHAVGTREGRTGAADAVGSENGKAKNKATGKSAGKVAAAAGNARTVAATALMALAALNGPRTKAPAGRASGPASAAAAAAAATSAQRHRAFTFRILRPTSEHAETADSGTQVVTCATCCRELDRYVCGVCERPFEEHDPLRDGHFPVSIVHFDKIIRSNVCYLHGRTDECMRMLKLAIRCFYGVVVPTCVAHAALAGRGEGRLQAPRAPVHGTEVVPVVHAVAVVAVPCVPVATATTPVTAGAGAGGASASVSYLDDEAGTHLYDAHVELEQLCEYSAEDIVESECGQHVVGVLRAFAGAYAARHAEWTAAQLVPRSAGSAAAAAAGAEPAQVHVTVYDAIAEVLTEFALEAEFGTSVQMLLKAKYRELARRFPYFVHRAGQHGLPSFAASEADFVRRICVKKHSLATKKLLRTTGTDVGLVAWAFRHFMAHLHGAMDGRPKTTRKWHRARPAPAAAAPPSDPAGRGAGGRAGLDAPGHEDQRHEEEEEEEDQEGEEDQGEDEVPQGIGEAQASAPAGKGAHVHDSGKPGSGLSEHWNLHLPAGEKAERRRRVRQLAAVLISKLYTKTVSAIENCEIAHRQPESIVYPDDFVDTPDGPVPSRPLAPSSLLVAVVGATTGLLEGVIVNPCVSGHDGGDGDSGGDSGGGACPPNMVRKLHQVCEGLNSNVRRLNTHADVLADSFALEHAESRDRECGAARLGDLARSAHTLPRLDEQ